MISREDAQAIMLNRQSEVAMRAAMVVKMSRKGRNRPGRNAAVDVARRKLLRVVERMRIDVAQ